MGSDFGSGWPVEQSRIWLWSGHKWGNSSISMIKPADGCPHAQTWGPVSLRPKKEADTFLCMNKLLLIFCLFVSTLASADSSRVGGVITLGKGMKFPQGAVIFISARPAAGGPPMAVKRIADAKLPLEFSLGQENSMMGGQLAGDVELTVRASQVSDPLTRTPGDLFGTLKTHAGAEKLKVVLDHQIQ